MDQIIYFFNRLYGSFNARGSLPLHSSKRLKDGPAYNTRIKILFSIDATAKMSKRVIVNWQFDVGVKCLVEYFRQFASTL